MRGGGGRGPIRATRALDASLVPRGPVPRAEMALEHVCASRRTRLGATSLHRLHLADPELIPAATTLHGGSSVREQLLHAYMIQLSTDKGPQAVPSRVWDKQPRQRDSLASWLTISGCHLVIMTS
jgi:hypothetical protein